MKVGIVGKGFVGSAVYEGLGYVDNEMAFYDPKYPESKFSDVLDCGCIFVCVPTNPLPNGECDVSIVESTLDKLAEENYKGLVAIKSTVVPGTTDKLKDKYPQIRLAFVPEFLRERSALSDFIDNHDVLIVGTYNEEDAKVLIDLHGNIPKSVSKMTPLEAELAKYFNNVYNTLRIVFANGFYEVCQKVGASYNAIFSAMIKRDNITPHYLRCSQSLRGASGPCLSKDPIAFMKYVANLELENPPQIFKTIVEDNALYPQTVIEGTREESEVFGKNITKEKF